jgi:hypothetical protein
MALMRLNTMLLKLVEVIKLAKPGNHQIRSIGRFDIEVAKISIDN